MPHPVLALWATPRTVSTAFERMMIERGDHQVFDEPYSMPYYYGPSKRSARFDHMSDEHGAPVVAATIEAARMEAPVFLKDMAYHALPYLDDAVLVTWTHTFLLRDPARAIPSLARMWPDFTDDEAGYGALADLHRRVEARGPAPVIDSHDLRRDPETTVGLWCDAVGIDRRPDALRWEAGMRPEWVHWRDWYEATASSTGFLPPDDDPPPDLDALDTDAPDLDALDTDAPDLDALNTDRVRRAIDAARPVYDDLRRHRINPQIA